MAGHPLLSALALAPAAEAFRAAFLEAAEAAAAGAPRTTLGLAGEVVAIDVAAPEVGALLLPALARLGATTDAPTLRIVVFHGPVPAFGWGAQHLGRGGAVAGLSHGPVRTAAAWDDSALVLWDEERRLAACWFAGAEVVKPWEAAAPLRTALHFALAAPGRGLVHAAAVGRAGRGVLLAGPGGSGKSTTTLACLEAGLAIAGDDYVALELGDGAPRAHGLYRSIKVGPGLGAPRGTDPERDGRRTLLIGPDLPGTVAPILDVAGIVLPRVAGGATSTLRPARGAEAVRALAPSTLMQAPREERPALALFSELVRRVPAWHLDLGEDRGVPALEELLAA